MKQQIVQWACIVSSVWASMAFGASQHVANPTELSQAVKLLKPGDEVILAAGEWRDADLSFAGKGTESEPIIFRAEEPGKTILTGASRIRISGQHLDVSGLVLRNLSGSKGDWIEFRYDSKRLASHCALHDCWLVEEAAALGTKENRWIGIYGSANHLRNCRIEGKKNKGATAVVWLGGDNLGGHTIESNYFGERPLLGKNGGETLRVGDSQTSLQSAKCLIAKNVFYRCDGETECISNKSCDNIYRGNMFLEVQGTLTLRHGNRCLVEENLFLGNKRSQTGGIRIIGEGHRIVRNYLVELEGDGFRSALTLVNGVPDAPLNSYAPVRDVVIESNYLSQCKHGILFGYNDEKEATVLPQGVLVRDQMIVARAGKAPWEFGSQKYENQASLDGIQLESNRVVMNGWGGTLLKGFVAVNDLTEKLPPPWDTKATGPKWFSK